MKVSTEQWLFKNEHVSRKGDWQKISSENDWPVYFLQKREISHRTVPDDEPFNDNSHILRAHG